MRRQKIQRRTESTEELWLEQVAGGERLQQGALSFLSLQHSV